MKKTDRFYELDAIRGLAALFVVFHHYTMNRPQANAFWRLGAMSVDAFFVVSGFVICMSLSYSKTWKEFLVKRFARIYPSYLICLAITTTVLIIFGFEYIGKATAIKFLTNLTLMQIYFGQVSMDGVYWSLTAEIWFYLLILLVFVSGNLRNIECICAICLAILCVTGLVTRLFPVHPIVFTTVFYYAPIIVLLPQLIAGIVFFKMKSEGITTSRCLLLAGCLLTVICMQPYDARMAYMGPTTFLVTLSCIGGVFILFIKNRLGFIVNPVTLFLGRISYPLYLLHLNIGLLVVLPSIAAYTGYWPAAILTMIIVMAVAFIVHKFVEQPFMNYIKNRYKLLNAGKGEVLTAIPQPVKLPVTKVPGSS